MARVVPDYYLASQIRLARAYAYAPRILVLGKRAGRAPHERSPIDKVCVNQYLQSS